MKKVLILLLPLIFLTHICYPQEDGSDCTSCCDGIDNDGDGWIDWDDFDCNQSGNPSDDCPWCTTESSCNNGVDDDGDGLIDIADSDCQCLTPLWFEDFESYPDGTMVATKWTTVYNDCDDSDINNGNNYWGVFNGEFRVNDIEGTCCSANGGNNDSYLLTEKINISSYSEVSISLTVRVTGDVECTGGCNSQDLLTAEYEVDGGGWNSFYTMCGATSGTIELNCEPVTIGNELQIRISVGNQANTETYYFDNIRVCPDNCGSVPLPLKPNKPKQVEMDTTTEKVIKQYYTYTLQRVDNPTQTGVYIVVYTDYTRGKIFIK